MYPKWQMPWNGSQYLHACSFWCKSILQWTSLDVTKAKKLVGHILLFETHMQVGNFNKTLDLNKWN
jgi:hypothetical protein